MYCVHSWTMAEDCDFCSSDFCPVGFSSTEPELNGLGYKSKSKWTEIYWGYIYSWIKLHTESNLKWYTTRGGPLASCDN